MTPAAIVHAARSWVGVPFRHQGRSRAGVDCAGLVVAVLREVGGEPRGFRDVDGYGRTAQPMLRELVERYADPVTAASPGVIVLIRWPGHSFASHVGWCTGPTLIHSHMRARAVVEHGYRGAWVRDTVALFAPRGLSGV